MLNILFNSLLKRIHKIHLSNNIMNNEINKKIIYIFKNIIYNLYLLIKSELYYLLESIYDYKNVINNIKETYRNKIYS